MNNSLMLLPAVYMPYMEGEHGEEVLISSVVYIQALFGSRAALMWRYYFRVRTVGYLIGFSDIPCDRCHGLNQSATRICGHDFTIMPAYCVVCRMRAITPPYAGNKRCLGPRTTGLLPAYDSTMIRMQNTTRTPGT